MAPDIAVLSMACRFPGADDPECFWANIAAGKAGIRFFSREESLGAGIPASIVDDPAYVAARGYVEGIELFDGAYFGYSPREAAMIDPQQRMLMECAHTALESAGWLRPQARVGVFAGTGISQYLLAMIANPELRDRLVPLEIIGGERDVAATRLAYKLGLTGPAYTVQTACSTSLAAIHLAVAALQRGECDAALAGGASLSVPAVRGYRYEEGGAYSPDGLSRTFDVHASGTVPGNGSGVVLLRRLADAVADGDPIQAVIKGSAAANDGANKVAFVAPSVTGQVATITAAYRDADVDPGSVGYIEAHGTATRLGDPVEVAALTEAFTANGPLPAQSCVLGSVKPNIGHLDTAAGIAGFIKAVQALRHRTLPGTLHFTAPNPLLRLESGPFHVLAEARPWPSGRHPRRTGVSSLGVGGTNVHVVLEEYVPQQAAPQERPVIVVASGRSAEASWAVAGQLVQWVAAQPSPPGIADLAASTTIGRRHGHFRVFAVAGDAAAVDEAFGVGATPNAVPAPDGGEALESIRAAADTPRTAFVFPGAGVQYVGMAATLYRREPAFASVVRACREALLDRGGPDILPLLSPPPGGPAVGTGIEDPALALPALFAVQFGLKSLLSRFGIEPEVLLGHSMGEYVAATVSGVMRFEDAVLLVHRRGELAARVPGAMLIVRLPADEIEPLLGERVSLAVVNAPDSHVLSGDPAAIGELSRGLEARGVDFRLLPVGASGHSPLLDPVLDEFRGCLRGVALDPPSTPWISNLTGEWITQEQATDPEYWVRHFRHPVRFADGLRGLAEERTTAMVIGPGRAVVGWAARLLPRRDGHTTISCLPGPAEAGDDERELLRAVGRFWAAGGEVDWRSVHAHTTTAGRQLRRLATPGIGLDRRRHWIPGVSGAWLGSVPPQGNPPVEDLDNRHERPELPEPFTAPETPTQVAVAEIWSQLLGISPVGVHDDFFELGGDSLLAVRIAASMRDRLRVGVQPALIVAARTIARTAAALTGGGDVAAAVDIEAPDLPAAALAAVSKLDAVQFGQAAVQSRGREAVVITGATGNLGPYLIRELLAAQSQPLVALVRAADEQQALQRTRAAMAQRSLWEPEFAGRLSAVPADLARPGFGLDEASWLDLRRRATAIYHAAAEVNFIRPFDRLTVSNVDGTVEVVRLAAESGAFLHHLSTLGVLDSAQNRGRHMCEEQGLGSDPGRLYTGYTQSKWVAEKVVQAAMERGLPATVYRIGMVAGDSATGRCNGDDLFWRFVATCARAGKAPHRTSGVAAVPVDRLAEILVAASLRRPSGVVHLCPEQVPWSQIWEWIGGLDVTSYGDWLDTVTKLVDSGTPVPLAPVMGALADLLPEKGLPVFGAQRIRKVLGLPEGIAPLTGPELRRSLRYLRNLENAENDRSLA